MSLYSCSEDETVQDPIKGKWQVTDITSTQSYIYESAEELNSFTTTVGENIDMTYEFMDNNVLVVDGIYDNVKYDEDGNQTIASRNILVERTDYWEANEDMSKLRFVIEGGFFEETWTITELTSNKLVKTIVTDFEFDSFDGPYILRNEVTMKFSR
ncbi:hypothetical protein [Flammeovirga sp. SJP92]|uniref:hypothetical protein n=1 Tax=Flammeovirga sp. SJP92 TaxID=1775430 RepID=UPI00155F8ACA|nr:hypothetical protein [Flammeovirga sp. SJP92]